MVDTRDLKSLAYGVPVRVRQSAPIFTRRNNIIRKIVLLCASSLFLSGCALIKNIIPQKEEITQSLEGKAAWYAKGTITASGEKFNPKELTGAHKTLPFGTLVRVTNLSNNKTAIVKINDRGPFVKTIDWDFSKQTAIDLDYIRKGIQRVRVDVIKTNYSKLLQK